MSGRKDIEMPKNDNIPLLNRNLLPKYDIGYEFWAETGYDLSEIGSLLSRFGSLYVLNV